MAVVSVSKKTPTLDFIGVNKGERLCQKLSKATSHSLTQGLQPIEN